MSVVLPPNPLSYEGQTTLPYISKPFPPPANFMQAPVPCLWNDTAGKDAYVQTYPGTWVPIGGDPGEVDTLTGDSGGAVGVDANQNINILGTSGQIVVTGTPLTNTLTISLAGSGTAVDSFTPDSGTSPVVPTAGGLITIQGGSGSTPNQGITVIGGTNSLSIETTFAKDTGTDLQLINPNTSPVASSIDISSGGDVTVPLGDLIVSRSQATGGPQIVASNTNNGAAANVRIVLSSAGAGDLYTLVDSPSGSAGSWEYGVKASDSSFQFQSNPANSAAGFMDGTLVCNLSTAGAITMPLQPAFLAYLATTATDKTGNGTSYTLGTDALTEVYDQGTNFNTNGTFTAPVTGIYDLRAQITITGATIATSFVISIVVAGTSARTYISTFTRTAGSTDQSVAISALAKMTATDTATVTIVASGEAADTDDILGAATAQTYFCGILAC